MNGLAKLMRVFSRAPVGRFAPDPVAFIAAATSSVFGAALVFAGLRYSSFGYGVVDLRVVFCAAVTSIFVCLVTLSLAMPSMFVASGILLVISLAILLLVPLSTAVGALALLLLAGLMLLRLVEAVGSGTGPAAFAGCVVGTSLALRHGAKLMETGYAHALVPEAVRAGIQHKDTIFHAAIAALFNQQGTVSIGLDGPVPLGYHALSHVVIGGLGSVLDLTAPEAYAMIVPVFLGPLMLAALLAAVNAVARQSVRTAPASMILACGIWAMMVANYFFKSYWASESYLLSLSLMLALIAVAASLTGKETQIRISGLLVIAVVVAAVSFAKISTGAVSACGMAVWLSMSRGRPTVRGAVEGVVFALLPFLAIYFLFFTAAAGAGQSVQPFAYLMTAPKRLWPPILLLVWLTVVVVRRKRIDAVEAGLLAMGWSAFAASALLNPVAGAAGYFAGPGHWATFVLAMHLWHPAETRKEGRGIVILAACLLAVGVQNFARRTPTLARDMAAAIELAGVRTDQPFSGPYGDILAAYAQVPDVDAFAFSPKRLGQMEAATKTCWAASLTVQALTGRPLL